ncbi:MAG TPA: cytochrome c peroxidase, partial [Thermoanaerobaculia bacterium]
APAAHPPSGADVDPPEVQVGERLFLETRFAQYFAAHGAGTNVPLAAGDPAMEALPTSDGPLPGPFAGLSMNCRNCHLVDDTAGAPTRTYADYSRQSLVPSRADGQERTPRNSPSLVNANLARPVPFLLHFDGEFASLDDLVRGTLTGRNFGWLPGEAPQAIAQIARVIREDDGSDANAQGFGGVPYRTLLTGTDPSIPAELVLPAEYRLDAASADDAAIFAAVARLISAYTVSLAFANASPYDAFLAKNGLPAAPDPGESDLAYSRRLRAAVEALADPVFVGPGDGEFSEHDQEFVFGPDELKGMKIFFREPLPQTLAGDPRYLSPRTGNCIACHAAPNFTDFSFHNTGVAQEEFDAAEGDGAFAALFVPDLGERAAHPDAFLPATAAHPAGSGVFRRPPLDLGVWNVYGNPDFPAPQAALAGILGPLSAQTLRDSIARFKTPGLRDLGQSGPYLHTGRKRDLEEVLELYAASSAKQRAGGLRNGADELSGMFLGEGDIDPLAAFLRALNEDYN